MAVQLIFFFQYAIFFHEKSTWWRSRLQRSIWGSSISTKTQLLGIFNLLLCKKCLLFLVDVWKSTTAKQILFALGPVSAQDWEWHSIASEIVYQEVYHCFYLIVHDCSLVHWVGVEWEVIEHFPHYLCQLLLSLHQC